MSEMVERVARAIWQSEGGDWPIQDSGWRSDYFDKARAVLVALREPTRGMLVAARSYTGEDAWVAMIDAALAEEKEPA